MTRFLTTNDGVAATLVTEDGQPFPVGTEDIVFPPSPGVIPPLYSVMLRPGDTSGEDNVFTSWGALYAACSAIKGGVRVNFDDSLGAIHIPAGTYDVDGWQWVNGAGAATVTIDDGAHATWSNLWIDGLSVVFNGATDFQSTTADANLYLNDGTTLTCASTGRFLSATGAGFAFVTTQAAVSIGDGTHAVLAASAGGTIEVFAVEGKVATVAIDGTGATSATINFNAGTFLDLPSYPNVTPIPGTPWLSPTNHFGAVGNGIADDTAALQAWLNITTALGLTCYLSPGNYLTSAPLLLPNGLNMWGTPGAFINSAMAGTGTEVNNPLSTTNPLATATTSTTADVVTESDSVDIALAIAPKGSIIRLRTAGAQGLNHWLYYVVQSTSNAGLTLKLDRPIKYPFAAGSTVDVVASRPSDITILGNGMQIIGSGDTALQLWGGTRVHIDDVSVVGNFSNWGITLDLGSDNVHVSNYRIYGTSNGFASSSNENCRYELVNSQNSASSGMWIADAIDVDLVSCCANGATTANLLIETNNVSTTLAGQRTRVIGGNFDGSQQTGINVNGPNRTTEIYGASVQSCQQCGVYVSGCDVDLVDCELGPAVAAAGNLAAIGIATVLPGVFADAGSTVRVRGGRLTASGGVGGAEFQVGICSNTATARVYVSDLYADIETVVAPGFVLFMAADDSVSGGSVMATERIRAGGASVGGATTYGYYNGGVGMFRILQDCDVDSIISANRRGGGGGAYNRGTFMSAIGAKAIGFLDLKTTDSVIVTPTTLPSGVGYVSAFTPGTGFSWTDTGATTYTYAIL